MSTAVAAGVVVAFVIAAAAAYFAFNGAGSGAGSTTQSSSTASSVSTPPQTTMIVMPPGVFNQSAGLNFSPVNVTVVVGVNNTITWTNKDSTYHTVKSETIPGGAQAFSSSPLNTGQTFTVTLTVPGTYHYECSLHPAWMQATIVVKQ